MECRKKIASYVSLLPTELQDKEPEPIAEVDKVATVNENKKECTICYETCGDDRKMVAFDPCGHTSCKPCSERLNDCHVCRQVISRKITLHMN